MAIGTALVVLGIAGASTYALFDPRTGKAAFDLKHLGDKIYDALTPVIEKYRGLRPTDIKVTRKPDDLEGRAVFNFSDVSILDYERLKEEATEAIEKASLKKNTSPDEANQEKTDKPAKKTLEPIQYYDVTLTIDTPDTRLGEIDFCDWRKRDDFHISITKKDSLDPLDPNSAEHDQVLTTLERYTKVSTKPNLTPNQIATNEIEVAGAFPITDWLTSLLDGKTRRQSLDILGNNNQHLSDPNYLNGLVELAINRAEKGDFSIIENYYKTEEQAEKNSLFFAERAQKKLAKHVKQESHQINRENLVYISQRIGLSIAVGVGVVVAAGIFGLAIVQPAVGAPLLGLMAAGSTAAVAFLGTKILAMLTKSTSITILTNNFWEGFSKRRIGIHKQELEKVLESQKNIESNLENISNLKNGAITTLKIINGSQKNDSLDLAGKKVGDLGALFISLHLYKTNTLPNCTALSLSKNGITDIGAQEIANAIQGAQRNQEQLNIHIQKIDLTNNAIKKDGLEAIKNALKNNLTLTTLEFDSKNADQRTKNEINRQLLINRYLQGSLTAPPKISSSWLPSFGLKHKSYDQKIYKELPNIFPEGFHQLITEAEQKLEHNFNITASPITTNESVIRTVKQNTLLQQIATRLSKARNTSRTANKCIDAYKLDSKRFIRFMVDQNHTEQFEKLLATEGLDQEKKKQLTLIMVNIANDQELSAEALIEKFSCLSRSGSQEGFAELQNLLNTQNYTLRQFAFPSEVTPDTDVKRYMKNITLRNQLRASLKYLTLPANKETLQRILHIYAEMDSDYLIAPEVQIEKLSSLIKDNLIELRSLTPAKLTDLLKTISTTDDATIIENAEIFSVMLAKLPENNNEISPAMLDLVQKTFAHFNTSHDEFIAGLKKKRQKMAVNSPVDRDALFILDSTINPKLGFDSSESTDYKIHQLHQLVIQKHRDASPAFTEFLSIYKTIPSGNRPIKIVITDNDDLAKNTAIFMGMLEQLPGSDINNIDSTMLDLLQKTFTHLHNTHSEFTKGLEKKRGRMAAGPIADKQELKEELFVIDSLTHPELKLDSPESDNYKTLQLQQILTGQKQDLNEFLNTYFSIDNTEERQIAMRDLLTKKNLKALLDMVKNDINSKTAACATLKQIDEEQRTELLAALLKDEPHALGIATIVSKLITISPSIDIEYIWRAFDWKTKYRWSFDTYIKELKDLWSYQSVIAPDLAETIQAGLRADLVSEFDCLKEGIDKSDIPSSFDKLKQKLEDNYDLTEFATKDLAIDQEVKNYIKFICQRNLLKQFTETSNLDKFFELYSTMAPEDCSNALAKIDNKKVLALINTDLGEEKDLDCAKLRSLNPETRIILFERAFSLDEDIKKISDKARLISALLNIDSLFDHAKQHSVKAIQDINSQFYWAITTKGYWGTRSGVPYCKFDKLKSNLEKILKDISKDTPELKAVTDDLHDALYDIDKSPERSQKSTAADLLADSFSKSILKTPDTAGADAPKKNIPPGA